MVGYLLLHIDTTCGLLSLIALSAGERTLTMSECVCPISVLKCSEKGLGSRHAFSFQDKSEQMLKLARFFRLGLIYTVCVLALLTSVVLFSYVCWGLSFTLTDLCSESGKRGCRAPQD